jgi:hypothetical protein
VVRITSPTIVIDAVRSLGTIRTDGAGLCKAVDWLRAVRTRCAVIIVASVSSAVLIFAAVCVVDTTFRRLLDDRGVCIKSIADDSTMLLVITKQISKKRKYYRDGSIDIEGALTIRNDIAISHGKTGASSAVLIFATVRAVDTTSRRLLDDRGVCIKSIADDSTMLLLITKQELSNASSDGIDIGGALVIRNDMAISYGIQVSPRVQ